LGVFLWLFFPASGRISKKENISEKKMEKIQSIFGANLYFGSLKMEND